MLSWRNLTESSQLDSILSDSDKQPVIIFKHSSRCAISGMAKDRMERQWPASEETNVYFLDLLRYRSVSNEIAERMAVEHQSPQLLIISKGQCVYEASHSDIKSPEVIEEINGLRK